MPRRFVLPDPPNPMTYKNRGEWKKAAYAWMQGAKGQIEAVSRFNAAAVGPFALGQFSLNTSADASTSGPDLADAFCTLVFYLQQRGIITPVAANLGRKVILWPAVAVLGGSGGFVGTGPSTLRASAVFSAQGSITA